MSHRHRQGRGRSRARVQDRVEEDVEMEEVQPEVAQEERGVQEQPTAQPLLLTLLQQQMQAQEKQQEQMQKLLERILDSQTSTSNNVRPKLNSYDGSTNYAVFKVQFDLTANRLRWSNEEKTIALVQALTGKATDVLESLSLTNTSVTFENLDRALTRTFAVAKTSTQKRYEFMSLRQREEQSYHEFALQVEKAGRAYLPTLPENDLQLNLLDVFQKGLRDRNVAAELRFLPIATLAEALDCINRGILPDGDAPPPTKRVRLSQPEATEVSEQPQQVVEPNTRIRVAQTGSPQTPNLRNQTYQQPGSTDDYSQSRYRNRFNTTRGRGRPHGERWPRGQRNFRQENQQQRQQGRNNCYACGEAHFVAQCPYVSAVQRTMQRAPPNAPPNYYQTAMAWYNPNGQNAPVPPPPNPPCQNAPQQAGVPFVPQATTPGNGR